jgi:hypothetical protein
VVCIIHPGVAMYELRLNGKPVGRYDDAETALQRVRLFTAIDPDAEPEIMDTRTGRAFEVAASLRWREELKARMR